MGRKVDHSIVGEEFGELTVLSLSPHRSKSGRETYWNCLCRVCKNIRAISRNNLNSGNTSSCGCRMGLAKKVADHAGVSRGVVSEVMRNKWEGKYSLKIANKVKQAAKELGYKNWYRVMS